MYESACFNLVVLLIVLAQSKLSLEINLFNPLYCLSIITVSVITDRTVMVICNATFQMLLHNTIAALKACLVN